MTTNAGLTTETARAARDAIEHCYAAEWTDGLPVVPCTGEVLEEFLATTKRDPDEELFRLRSVNRACTVRDAAVNAVMAGCLPEYLPIVIAAWEAIDRDGWAGLGMLQSTSGAAPMAIVNGPIRERVGLNSAGNVFGSGFRANATIGRSLRLGAMNALGLVPHVLDQSTQGQPARIACCIAENEEASPWPGLHEDLGFDAADSTVTVMTIRSVSHVEARHTRHPEQLLHDLADSIARTGFLLSATTAACVVLGPEHATLLAEAGVSKQAARELLVEKAVIEADRLARAGKDAVASQSGLRVPSSHADAVPDGRADNDAPLPVLESLNAVQIVVAGAHNSGVSSVVGLFGQGTAAPQPVLIDPA